MKLALAKEIVARDIAGRRSITIRKAREIIRLYPDSEIRRLAEVCLESYGMRNAARSGSGKAASRPTRRTYGPSHIRYNGPAD